MATTTQSSTNVRFSRWTKYGRDRIYVNGVSPVEKYWLEEAADGGFNIKTTRPNPHCDVLHQVNCEEILDALHAELGGEPTWTWSQLTERFN